MGFSIQICYVGRQAQHEESYGENSILASVGQVSIFLDNYENCVR